MAASSALARAGQELSKPLTRWAEAEIEAICAARFLTDGGDVFEKVVKAHLGYWQGFGAFRALLRKLGIGEHPFS